MSLFRPRFTLLALVLATALPLWAGQWHTGASLVCSDCHTQHNSENGQPMRTDNNPNPARMLLRRGSALELCLSCHDGMNPAAPDVIAPVTYAGDTAAGAFPNSGGVPTNLAHHLENPSAEVPPGGSIPMVLTCTTCHDPHGNGNYRNLRPDPTRTGLPDVTVIAHQQTVADGSNPAVVYVPSNIIYKSGISTWCSRCHENLPPSAHRGDKAMFGSALASYPAWTSTTLPRVPVDSPTDNVIPSVDDEVTCLSCHKAHGSASPGAVIYADGVSMSATCSECHDP